VSDFTHLSRVTAPNVNKDYIGAFKKNQEVFKRKNGMFTGWFNNINE
jgi:hypothetical protein